jgi:H2-forming N5,N10-methylenetetrahydromethanopterin dehydrogenase-like enzyme
MINRIIDEVMKEIAADIKNGGIDGLFKKMEEDKGFQEFLKMKEQAREKNDCNCKTCNLIKSTIEAFEEAVLKFAGDKKHRENLSDLYSDYNDMNYQFMRNKVEEHKNVLFKALKNYLPHVIALDLMTKKESEDK